MRRLVAVLAAIIACLVASTAFGHWQMHAILDVVCALVVIGSALTVRRRYEERSAELEAFAGRIAHDILSPLGTVGVALALARQQPDETQRRRLLERGVSAAERIKTLVVGLLEFARAGGKPPDGAHADLDATVKDLLSELEPTAREAGAELTTAHDRKHVLACNPGVLTSLIANLARNAIKYLGDRPVRRVEIRARERGRYVRVEVADTGPGLPPAIEKRVFDPYVRAPNAREPGFGLGLATVRRLAEAHGGRVGVESVPGSGSTFWFELPKANDRIMVCASDALPLRLPLREPSCSASSLRSERRAIRA